MRAASVLAAILVLMGMSKLGATGSGNSERATDAAFRDGRYLGKLAAERGESPHIAVGRWATAADRASFTAGYEQAYNEVVAQLRRPALQA